MQGLLKFVEYVGFTAFVLTVAVGVSVAGVFSRTVAERIAKGRRVPVAFDGMFDRLDELHAEFFGK